MPDQNIFPQKIKDALLYISDGFVTNNLLGHESNDGEIDMMCNDLIGMIIIRIDYLFEQNCSSLGYFAAVQLLLCLQNHFPIDNSGHHERVKEIQDKIENSRCQLDKKSSALYNFYLETVQLFYNISMKLIAIWKVSTSLKFFDATEEFKGWTQFNA